MSAHPAPGLAEARRARRGAALLLAGFATALLVLANVVIEILRGDAAPRALADQLEARELALFAIFFVIAFRVARRQLARARPRGDGGPQSTEAGGPGAGTSP